MPSRKRGRVADQLNPGVHGQGEKSAKKNLRHTEARGAGKSTTHVTLELTDSEEES